LFIQLKTKYFLTTNSWRYTNSSIYKQRKPTQKGGDVISLTLLEASTQLTLNLKEKIYKMNG